VEDANIVALYWQRDQGAITASDEKYGTLCHSLSFNILQTHEDAEECVNDTWHKAWDTMPPQKPNSLRAYFCRIVRNLSIDRWRGRYSQKRGEGMGSLVLELEECVPAVPSAEEQWETEEIGAAVERWLRQQRDQDRRLFVGRYFYGAAVRDLAVATGGSPNGTTQRLRRLRNSLRRALEQEGVTL